MHRAHAHHFEYSQPPVGALLASLGVARRESNHG